MRPDAKTLVILHTQDFREGHERGRWDYLTRSEEPVHTEDELLDLFKARAQDNLCLGRLQEKLRWAFACIVGELSGRLFPLTQQPYLHSMAQAKQMTVLQKS